MAADRLTIWRLTAIVGSVMPDPYEEGLKKLRADRRSNNELERVIGIPAETIRDIRQRICTNPRFQTVKKIARHYERQAA